MWVSTDKLVVPVSSGGERVPFLLWEPSSRRMDRRVSDRMIVMNCYSCSKEKFKN